MNVLYKHDVGMNKDKSGYNLDFTVDDFTKCCISLLPYMSHVA